MRKVLIILFFYLFSDLNAQNIVRYELSGEMSGVTTLWDGNVTPIWGFREITDDPTVITLPGPTIVCNEGDSVIIGLSNPSFEAHTIHLHGLDVDQANDGVPSTSFFIFPGQKSQYSFKATHAGNYLYHCHVGTVLHVQMGMFGALIVNAANGAKEVYTGGPSFDTSYTWLMSELDKSWHDDYTQIGSFTNFDPDYFLVNGKSKTQIFADSSISIYQQTAGDTIYTRLLNIGYGLNRVIFPPLLNAEIISSDGRPIPNVLQKDTIDLYPGERFGVIMNSSFGFVDSVTIEYRSLFKEQLWGVEKIPVSIIGPSNSLEKSALVENEKLIWPNPVADVVNSISGPFIFRVYDLQGRELISGNESALQNITDLIPGFYTISMDINGGLKRQSFIKK